MPNGYEMEDLETLVEMLESDESDESDEMMAERSRRRSFRRPRTAPGRGTMTQRPQPGNLVTEAQLQAALARVEQQLRTNSAAIQTVSDRVNTVAADQTRQATALRREIAGQRRQTEALRRDINQRLQLSAIFPLLLQRSVTLREDVGNSGLRANDRVALVDQVGAILPLALMGGFGQSGGQGGSPGSDSSSDMTPLLLILALSGGLGGSGR
jgi:hypothetical protein